MKRKSPRPSLKRIVQTFLAYGDHLQSLAFWVSAFLAAFICVTYAWLFKLAEADYRGITAFHPQAAWIWTPFCLLLSWALVVFLAPEATGSGIPQVLAANDLNYKRNKQWVDRPPCGLGGKDGLLPFQPFYFVESTSRLSRR